LTGVPAERSSILNAKRPGGEEFFVAWLIRVSEGFYGTAL
jgi:hypothetical protein